VRFENKNMFFWFEKLSSLGTTYNVGVVVVNSKVDWLLVLIIDVCRAAQQTLSDCVN
jgi:hypothetical protein